MRVAVHARVDVFCDVAYVPRVASLDLRWLHAQANLAWKLVAHYLKKLWPWAPRYGLAQFQKSYVAEGLPPSTPAFRAIAHEPGRCTACTQCDTVCPILRGDKTVPGDFVGPMTFVLSVARSAPNLEDARATLAALNGPVCDACRACDAACPERIPIAQLAAVLEDQRVVIERAKQGVLPLGDVRALPPPASNGSA